MLVINKASIVNVSSSLKIKPSLIMIWGIDTDLLAVFHMLKHNWWIKRYQSVMIPHWENECISPRVCHLCGLGSIPSHSGEFQGSFPWLITLYQPVLSHAVWLKMVQSPLNGTTQLVDVEEEGQRPFTDRQWLAKKWQLQISKTDQWQSCLRCSMLSHIGWTNK